VTRGITRRSFIEAAGSTLVLSLGSLRWSTPARAGETASGAPVAYRSFEDLYRQRWRWDRVAKGTHYVNCWYQRACSWNVYVKDGVVWREEQAGQYPQTRPGLPDFNPRGCQKGACYSERMVDAGRLRHPLRRVGARGEGKWKRVTWERALREIADATIDVLASDGPGAVVWDQGTQHANGCAGLGVYRTSFVLDTPTLDMGGELGDHHPGAVATCGKVAFASSADDLFYSDLILIWGGNPTYTQIPNAHFINEARYNGARVVTIAPDFNASAVHADEWIPVKIASDAALGLSLAHVIVEDGLADEAFLREQTDLPLLVRRDDRRLLREADLVKGGAEDRFYVFDRKSAGVRQVSRRTLALGKLDPALTGVFSVETLKGEVTVSPVFSLLHRRLLDYSPEKTQEKTGVHANTVRRLAHAIAAARGATCITQSNFGKYYHGLEMERAQILVFALAGQMGKKGAGFMGFPHLSIDGSEGLAGASGSLPPWLSLAAMGLELAPSILKMKLEGYTQAMTIHELAHRAYVDGGSPSSQLFFHLHGGVESLYGSSKQWDPDLPRPVGDYLKEAFDESWQFAHETPPRILFESGGNLLRRIRAYDKLIDELLPRLDLLVTFDWRMSNTALYSDYVLPAAGWYEKDDINFGTPISPYAHAITRAVEPLGESKSDWEFHCLFLKTLQERAVARGLSTYTDRAGNERRLDRVYDQFTFGRRYTEANPEEFLDEILAATSNLGGVRWKELKEKGFARFTGLGSGYLNNGIAADIAPGETITANTWHTEKKQPWPTLTRRMQFYIDQDLYLELGEELPVHKDDPPIGGDYPLILTGGHTRWSIHAMWRDEKHMLQLQRGVPVAFVAAEDAAARGIADGDPVRLYNDVNSVKLQAKVSATVRPGQVIVYHGWEPYQFGEGKSHATLTPSPINPIQLAGGYFHLRPRVAVNTPGAVDRGARVELERLGQRTQIELDG
jgi:DMSO reductase family type II enzyme molybdopterin subunit